MARSPTVQRKWGFPIGMVFKEHFLTGEGSLKPLRSWDRTCGTQPASKTKQSFIISPPSSAWLSLVLREGWVFITPTPPASSRSWVPQNPHSGDRGDKAGAVPGCSHTSSTRTGSAPRQEKPQEVLKELMGMVTTTKTHSCPQPCCRHHPKCHGHTDPPSTTLKAEQHDSSGGCWGHPQHPKKGGFSSHLPCSPGSPSHSQLQASLWKRLALV